MSLVLYSYFRSSAAYRVRIALNLKGLSYSLHPVHLLRDGGEQNHPSYLEVNPLGLVPALRTEHGVIQESSAIIEYLEERYPDPPLLPEQAADRAFVRSLAQMVACDIHPLNNLRVLNFLWPEKTAAEQKMRWMHHWLGKGFAAIERKLSAADANQGYCFGKSPGLADLFLIPQVYNALRFEHDLSAYPLISKIYQHCSGYEAFRNAAPEVQPDSPKQARSPETIP